MRSDYRLKMKLAMIKRGEESFESLSKEELEKVVKHYNTIWSSIFKISEVCVDQSKHNISSDKAVRKIREYLGEVC